MEKKPIYFFFHFWFKNKQVWAEEIGNKQKNSKNLKVVQLLVYLLSIFSQDRKVFAEQVLRVVWAEQYASNGVPWIYAQTSQEWINEPNRIEDIKAVE